MTDKLIDFLQRKSDKEDDKIERIFQKAHSLDDKLEVLLQQKDLQVEDHKLFLAFLSYSEQQNQQAQQIFKDVIRLPKHQFTAAYNMSWAPIVKLTATFLAILKQSSTDQYEAFRQQVNTL